MIEKEFISYLMSYPERLPRVMEIISPKHIDDSKISLIYKIMIDLYADNEDIDIIKIYESSAKELQVAYVNGLYTEVNQIDIVNASQKIYENYLEREFKKILATKEEGDIFERIGLKGERLFQLLRDFEKEKNDINLVDMVPDIIEETQERSKGDSITLRSESFPTLNELMNGGAMPGNLVTISGREKDGKTSLGLRLVLDYSLYCHAPSAIFSYEVSKNELAWKALSYEGSVNYDNFRNPIENPYSGWDKLANQLNMRFGASKIFINDEIFNEIELRSKIKALKLKYNIQAVMIDYISLVPSVEKHENNERRIATISRNLKALAKELSIVIVILSQRNRGDDIAESLALQRDSDFAIAIKYPHLYNDASVNYRGETIPFLENEFFVRLTHSRHSIPCKWFKAFYNRGNFIELETQHEL